MRSNRECSLILSLDFMILYSRHAAGLLVDVDVEGILITEEEVDILNYACTKAGLNFIFNRQTKLIYLSELKLASADIFYIKVIESEHPLSVATAQPSPAVKRLPDTDRNGIKRLCKSSIKDRSRPMDISGLNDKMHGNNMSSYTSIQRHHNSSSAVNMKLERSTFKRLEVKPLEISQPEISSLTSLLTQPKHSISSRYQGLSSNGNPNYNMVTNKSMNCSVQRTNEYSNQNNEQQLKGPVVQLAYDPQCQPPNQTFVNGIPIKKQITNNGNIHPTSQPQVYAYANSQSQVKISESNVQTHNHPKSKVHDQQSVVEFCVPVPNSSVAHTTQTGAIHTSASHVSQYSRQPIPQNIQSQIGSVHQRGTIHYRQQHANVTTEPQHPNDRLPFQNINRQPFTQAPQCFTLQDQTSNIAQYKISNNQEIQNVSNSVQHSPHQHQVHTSSTRRKPSPDQTKVISYQTQSVLQNTTRNIQQNSIPRGSHNHHGLYNNPSQFQSSYAVSKNTQQHSNDHIPSQTASNTPLRMHARSPPVYSYSPKPDGQCNVQPRSAISSVVSTHNISQMPTQQRNTLATSSPIIAHYPITPPESPNAQTSHTVIPYTFENLTISCLVKNPSNQMYALIEVVSKLYFDDYKSTDLEHVMKVRLFIPVVTLSRDEELAFITFYGLKTDALVSNLAVNVSDFVKYYAFLRDMLPRKRPPRLTSNLPRDEDGKIPEHIIRQMFGQHVKEMQDKYNRN